MQQILKSTSKKKDHEASQSWWKKNKRRKPVKYHIESLFGKSGLDKDSFKWYYPDSQSREKTEEAVSSSTTESSTEDPAMLTTETTKKTSTSIPGGNFYQECKQLVNFQKSKDVSCNFSN